jgi:hypothetical protein
MRKYFSAFRSLPYKYKIPIIIYILWGLSICLDFFLGLSTFLTTIYIYSFAALVLLALSRKLNLSANFKLLMFSVLLALFGAEFILRFIVKYPITYSEKRGEGYYSVYKSPSRDYIQFKLLGIRKDFHTLEFDSGEVRNYECSDYHYPDENCNALGLRGKLPAKNKKVVLFLGDSFTEGVGAPTDSSIPFLVNKHIVAGDSNAAVLNGGISGNDMFFDWKMLQKLAPLYALKQVVFISNTTDIGDVLVRGGNERFCPNGNLSYNPAPWWEPLYSVSFVFRLIMHNALKLNYLLLTPEEEQIRKQAAADKMTALLKNEIVPWANSHGVPVLVVLIPLYPDISATEGDYNRLYNGFKSVPGIQLLNCMPAIKSQTNIPGLYWPTDGHFRPAGYNIISQYIINSGLL